MSRSLPRPHCRRLASTPIADTPISYVAMRLPLKGILNPFLAGTFFRGSISPRVPLIRSLKGRFLKAPNYELPHGFRVA